MPDFLPPLTANWQTVLAPELKKPYVKELINFIETEYNYTTCYPPKHLIFEALNVTAFQTVKVVIIGQDPYHSKGQAHGLCFSVPDSVAYPPSLKNIFKELQTDIQKPYPETGNLVHWANQGVLLLNSILTVRASQAGSHKNKGWEILTTEIIKCINAQLQGVVFLLWGSFANGYKKWIDTNKHYVLTSGHPSPLSANRGYWFGNKHFSKTNALLLKQQKAPILW